MAINPHLETFNTHQAFLSRLSYSMLGTTHDAEDVLQDAWLRWADVPACNVVDGRRFLASIVSRLCIDKLRRRRLERRDYVGPWLPEPIVSSAEDEVVSHQQLSFALMVILENLSPIERAVYLLRERRICTP